MNAIQHPEFTRPSATGTLLLICVTLEAALLGGGRIIEVHGLTLKMWLFLAAQIYTVWQMVCVSRRITLATTLTLVSFSVLLLVGILTGLVTGAAGAAIAEDVKPLFSMFSLAFFDLSIRSEWHLRLVLSIIRICSLLMASAYIAVIGLLAIGILPFSVLYETLSNVGVEDFMFRGDTGSFFYKGAIYLGIGVILFAWQRGRKAVPALGLLGGGLLVTGTRGFFLGLGAVMLAHVMVSAQSLMRRVRYASAVTALAALAWVWFATSTVDRSDSARPNTIHQVVNQISPATLLTGHGFGNGVPERPVHMEISYLEIFHKQGLIGVGWWGSFLSLFWFRYRQARRDGNRYAEPLFLCVLFVAVVSATNPFINNPIGITICLVALVGLRPGICSASALDQRSAVLA